MDLGPQRMFEPATRGTGWRKLKRETGFEPATGGFEGGVPPSRGDTTRSERARGRGPLAGAGEASPRAEPATERGSNPVSRSIPHFV